jgi:ribosomal protein L29
MSTDYDTDFYAWAEEQARLLRSGRFSQLDIAHVAEEIEDLGKRERRALESRLGALLGHLLKWRFQADSPNRKSWRATINAQRRSIARLLDDNPSLRPQLHELLPDAYADAVDRAVAETPLDYDAFPQQWPWTIDEILGQELPDARSARNG